MIFRSLLCVRFVISTYSRLLILELKCSLSLSRSKAVMNSSLIQHYSFLIKNEFKHAFRHVLKINLKFNKRWQIVSDQVQDKFDEENFLDDKEIKHWVILILICDELICKVKSKYVLMNFAEIDSVNCRSFDSTIARIFNTDSQHDCVERSLEVIMNKMNLKLDVSIMTNEELNKTLNMCLRYFWLLKVIKKFIVSMNLLLHRSIYKRDWMTYTAWLFFKSIKLRVSLRSETVKDWVTQVIMMWKRCNRV